MILPLSWLWRRKFRYSVPPVPTNYSGVWFRSRLEARYAFVFNSLGILWQYEPGAFDCGAAGIYLPDFYLPQSGWYVEIKPGRKLVTAEAQAKIKAFPHRLKVLYGLSDKATAKFLASVIRGSRAAEVAAITHVGQRVKF